MKIWAVQDAKARFSELLGDCLASGPQMVSKRGEVQAVLVPLAEWQRLTAGKRDLKDFLLSDENRFDLDLPPRGQAKRRPY